MYSLIYLSIAPKALDQDELAEILRQSRPSNKAHDLTGCLAYIEGIIEYEQQCRFIQVLEGPELAVLNVFEKIQSDNRHTEVTLIHKGPIESRNFGLWEMGFEKISFSSGSPLKEFFQIDPQLLSEYGDINDNMLLEFMKSFYQHLK